MLWLQHVIELWFLIYSTSRIINSFCISSTVGLTEDISRVILTIFSRAGSQAVSDATSGIKQWSLIYYCNVAFAGLPRCELDRLQSVVNAAARLTVWAQLHDHITPLLADLHWLRIPQRIQYKLCVLVFNACMGSRRDIYKRSSVRSRTLSHDVACALPPRQT